MGAVAGAADERPPRANPPTDRMMEMFEALMSEMKTNARDIKKEMKENIEANARDMGAKMDANTRELRGEMQRMGRSMQAGMKGIMAIARDET